MRKNTWEKLCCRIVRRQAREGPADAAALASRCRAAEPLCLVGALHSAASPGPQPPHFPPCRHDSRQVCDRLLQLGRKLGALAVELVRPGWRRACLRPRRAAISKASANSWTPSSTSCPVIDSSEMPARPQGLPSPHRPIETVPRGSAAVCHDSGRRPCGGRHGWLTVSGAISSST